MIDFPQKISSVIFTAGCNFRCPFCHNPLLILKNSPLPDIQEEHLLNNLKERFGFIDGVVITGGEPFIHADLLSLTEKIKKLNFSVKIDTNGYYPEKLLKIMEEGLVDYIAMDIKTSLSGYHRGAGVQLDVSRIENSIQIIKNGAIEHEFRTTVVPGIVNKFDIEKISKILKGANRFVIQQFNPENTLDSRLNNLIPYSHKTLMNFAGIARSEIREVLIRN